MKKTSLYIIILLLSSTIIPAQTLRFIPLHDPWYDYADYLINSGQWTPQFVLQQPYATTDSLPPSAHTSPCPYDTTSPFFALLALQESGLYSQSASKNRYLIEGSVALVYPHITLVNRTTIDQEYKYDPKFAGDLSESDHWLYGRVNEAYMQLHSKGFGLFIGRMARNWGPPGGWGLALSDFAYTWDQVLFSWQNSHLRLSVIFARLEDLPAYVKLTQQDTITYYPNARKYIAGHRFDIRLSDRLQFALTGMATYGGPDRETDLSFINPMTFYYALQRNDKKQMDGQWSLDLYYKPLSKMTLYGQFLLDDIILNNDPGVNDRGRYPDRLGVTVSARAGDLPLKGLNAGLTYVRIWNRTYQSKFTWENYHYRGLGLGYPAAGLEEIKLKLGYWGWFPLYIQNETILGRYGDVQLTDLFPLEKEPFPLPPVTHNLVNTLQLTYFAGPAWRIFLSLRNLRRANFFDNRFRDDGVYQFRLGVRWQIGIKH